MNRGEHHIAALVTRTIANKRERWGRAYATFLAGQVARLDAAFGRSKSRIISPQGLKRNRYRVTCLCLQAFGHSEQQIADMTGLSKSAVHRLLSKRP